MNEAIGNTLLFNLTIVFVVILIAFFVGSLSYSKAYKVKNKIVEEIEKQGEYASDATKAYDLAYDEIKNWLGSGNSGQSIGYRKNTFGTTNIALCRDECISRGTCTLANKDDNDYQYCVYMFNTCNNASDNPRCGVYYKVTTYMYFNVPIVGDIVKIPVSSETMTFAKLNG